MLLQLLILLQSSKIRTATRPWLTVQSFGTGVTGQNETVPKKKSYYGVSRNRVLSFKENNQPNDVNDGDDD